MLFLGFLVMEATPLMAPKLVKTSNELVVVADAGS